MNWDLIASFSEVAELGSLSAAARKLGISQPTISRQIQQLEKQCGFSLFERSSSGLTLTEQGKHLVGSAHKMQDAADEFTRRIHGEQENLSGSVRISVNEIVATYMMPKAIKQLQQQHPQIQIELVVSNKSSSLSKRDADIALRMYKPEQLDLVAKKLGDIKMGVFAHAELLKAYGEPKAIGDLFNVPIIGYDNESTIIDGAKALGFELTANDFPVRCDVMPVHIALARLGVGVLFTHKIIGESYPELIPILADFNLGDLPFWLVCHPDVQFNPNIQAVMRVLAEQFTSIDKSKLII